MKTRSLFNVLAAASIILIILFVYIMVGVSILQSRKNYENQAALTTKNLSESVEINVAGILDKINLGLYDLANETKRQLSAGGIDEKSLNGYIIRQKTLIPEFEEMWVADGEGNVRYGSNIPKDKLINITDREYYQRLLRDPETELVISKPVMGRITKDWSILICRRINNPDGSLAGVAFGSLRVVDYFSRMFSKLHVGKNGFITLRGGDLSFIVRYPEIENSREKIGSVMISDKSLAIIKDNPDSATYTAIYKVDNTERTYSYRKIRHYPFYVFVAMSTDDYLSPWYQEIVIKVLLLLCFTAVVIFSFWILNRRALEEQKIKSLEKFNEELKASEEKYHNLYRSAAMGIFHSTLEGRFIDLNPALARLLGYETPEEAMQNITDIAKQVYAVSHDRDNMAAEAVKTDGFIITENCFLNRNGSQWWGRLHIRIISDKQGKPSYYEGFVEDVTERKEAIDKLLKSETLFRAIVEHNYEGILLMSEDRKPFYVSPSYTQICGYSPEELIGVFGPDYIHQDDREIVADIFRNLLESHGTSLSATYRLRHKKGHWFWVETTATNLLKDPFIHGVVLNIRDITESIKAEIELIAAKEQAEENGIRFKAISEQAMDGISLTDLEGNYVFVNQAFCKMLGYSDEELLQMSVYNLKVPDDNSETFKGTISSGQISVSRKKLLCKDKSIISVDINGKLILISGKEFIIGIARDVTKQVEVENELIAAKEKAEKNEQKYRLIADNTADNIWTMDMNLRFTYMSPSITRLSGWTVEEAMSRTIDQSITPESMARANKALADELTKENLPDADKDRVLIIEFEEYHKNGSTRWTENSISFIRNDEGKPVQILGVTRDITERKLMEKTLLKSEHRFRTAFMTGANAYLIAERDTGRMIEVNNRMMELYGFKKEEFIGHTSFELGMWVYPDEREKMLEKLRKEGRIYNLEVYARRKNGEAFWVQYSVSELETEGTPLILGVIYDITERKQAEESLIKSLREKETLIREIYHRTKNTMQVVRGIIVLQSAAFPENSEMQQLVKNTEDRIDAISLVHQMLYQSQDLSQISIKEYIHNLAELILQSYSLSSDRISFNIIIDEQLFLIDTAIPLGLILNELITNSLKYAFPDNRKGIITITLTIKELGKNILFYSDNGIGVSEGFDFRNNNSLGLKLIHRIGEKQMLGKLQMQNINGISCLFEFPGNLYKARV